MSTPCIGRTHVRIYLTRTLRSGKNIVAIKYTNLYDHDGDGFHQFIDPEDDEVLK